MFESKFHAIFLRVIAIYFLSRGEFTYAEGGIYRGRWENDMRHGAGIFEYPDGSVYDGNWHNNFRQGKGNMSYSDGSQYVGQWQNDQKHGQGIQIKFLDK